ncbi:MAG TPA: HD-GYP domain-containing protein, partial [Rectinemataceae bacterium]
PGEVVGKRLLDVFPNHRGKSVFNAYINAATTGTTQIIEEVFVENMIGKPLWLRLVVESMGEDIAIMAVDITEHKKNAERLRRMLDGTVNTILQILDTRDPYTAGHERRVAEIAMGIAAKMGLPPDQIDGLRTACLLHDVGKVIVPSEILSMPRKLSSVEFKLIQVHPESGYDILKDIEFPWPVARATLEHHERLDGSGYPRGLKGHELCLESKILAVADVVEAMSSHRPYRPSLGIDAALKEISSNRGILYDSEVVDACLFVFKEDARASLRQYR